MIYNLQRRCVGILCTAALGIFLTLPGRVIANDTEFATARAAIENLLSPYLHGIDFRDPDMFASTFTEDGVLNHGCGITQGHEALREFIHGEINNDNARVSAAGVDRLAPPRHVISNILIDLQGDSAVVRDYWVYYTTGEDGQPYYRERWPIDKAVAYLTEKRGSQFDPDCVDKFLATMDEVESIMARFLELP